MKWRGWSLVIVLAIASGFGLNFLNPNKQIDFISPTVFARQARDNSRGGLSPFGILSSQNNKTALGSTAKDLSYLNQVKKVVGSVLGESTKNTNPASTIAGGPVAAVSSGASSSSANSATSMNDRGSSNSSSSSSSNASSVSGTTSLTTTQQAVQDVTFVVLNYLKTGNYTALYNLMSADFKNTFNLDDFVASFSSSVATDASVTSDPRIFGANNEWGEQAIKLVLADGTNQNYLNIYHFESNAWTLYATQDQ